jgi:hypothetical protein
MTTRTLSIAVALVAAANGATAQRAPSVPPWSRVHAPATFKPDLCVARIVPGDEPPSRFAVPSRTITIVIDKRFRMDVMPLPSRASGAGFAFAPHDFLCDGKTHHVEVRWPTADPTTHQVTFPVSRPAGARPPAR